MPSFDWLKAYQSQRRPNGGRQVSFAVVPLSMRGQGQQAGQVRTGAGPDGIVQQAAPVGMMPNGQMVHEGETAIQGGPGGTFIVDAIGTAAAGAGGPLNPQPLDPIQMFTQPVPNVDLPMPAAPAMAPGMSAGRTGGVPQAVPQPMAPSPMWQGGMMHQPTPQQQQMMQRMEAGRHGLAGRAFGGSIGNFGGSGLKIPGTETLGNIKIDDPAAPKAPPPSPLENAMKPIQNIQIGTDPAITTGMNTMSGRLQSTQQAQQAQVEAGPQMEIVQPVLSSNIGAIDTMGDRLAATQNAQDNALPPPPAQRPPSRNEVFRNAAMGRLLAQMRGGDPAQQAAAQRGIDDLNAQNVTQQMVAAQQAAQGDLDSSVAAARQAGLTRTQSGAVADATAQMGIEQAQAQREATTNLATQAATGQQFDWSRQNTVVQGQIAAGDYTGANATLKAAGMPEIDFTNIIRKEEAGDLGGAAETIFGWIGSMDPAVASANPGLVSALSQVATGLLSRSLELQTGQQIWDQPSGPITGGAHAGATYVSTGSNGYTFKAADGSEFSLTRDEVMADDNIVAALPPLERALFVDNNPDDPAVTGFEKVADDVLSYFQTGDGRTAFESLKYNPAFAELMGQAANGSTAAQEEIGRVLGLMKKMTASTGDPITWAATNGLTVQDAMLLRKYGRWDDAQVSALATATGAPLSTMDWTTYVAGNNGRLTNMPTAMVSTFVQAVQANDPAARRYVMPATDSVTSNGTNPIYQNITKADPGESHVQRLDWDTYYWAEENKGKVIEVDGRLLRIEGAHQANRQANDGDPSSYLTFTDLSSNPPRTLYKQKNRWYSSEPRHDTPAMGLEWTEYIANPTRQF